MGTPAAGPFEEEQNQHHGSDSCDTRGLFESIMMERRSSVFVDIMYQD
jgi:hypothetical protein